MPHLATCSQITVLLGLYVPNLLKRQADHLCVRTSGLGLVQFLFCIITNIFLLYGNKSKSVHRIEGRTGQRFCPMSLPLSVLPDSTVREKDLRDVVEQMPDTPRAQQRLVYCTSM
jgi:hypothetical protein